MNTNRNIKTVSFYTLGCKLNQAETETIAADFRARGYRVVPFKSEADLTVINTCTVTNDADSKSRQVIRGAIKASPSGRIVAMGCYAQVRAGDLAAIEGVDLVLGTSEKYRLAEYLEQLTGKQSEKPLVFVNGFGDSEKYLETPFISATSRTRAFLKIQEGCDYYCSYCIIPFARGRARSRGYAESIREAGRLAADGYREIVLTGINIGTWQDDDGRDLADLLAGLSAVAGLERIRISSIEPNTVTDRLLSLVAERPNICPHLHVPLQSGAASVLERMRRKYSPDDFRKLLERIGKIAPGIALGTDVIVGFPGETDMEFQQTVDLIRESPFTYLHIFRYSERTGTVASRLPEQVDFQVKKKRAAILHELGAEKKREYIRAYLGTVQPVLFETTDAGGWLSGMTANYIRAKIRGDSVLTNCIRPVRLQADTGSYVRGELAEGMVSP
ncbi:MAG: tRNA (N(6)-L-threonylcarbamoyladenosine(37)-C(2))-methylthiotransferase MtaB [Candidatus Neomarinimicrobiota bacterium]